jgi:predicted dehydrogenase
MNKDRGKLRLGFVGGSLNSAIGYIHFNACRMDGAFSIEAGNFSLDRQKNLETSKIFGVNPSRIYNTWQEFLENERGKLDAVVVLTPTPTHQEICIQALSAGFDVICEKALSTSSEGCRKIYEAILKNGRYLAVTYNYSGYPMVRQLRELIQGGRFGKLHQIHIEMPQEGFLRKGVKVQNWRAIDSEIPTVSLDLGVHIFHLVDFLTDGLRPISIWGDHASFGLVPGVIDNVYCFAKYESELRLQAWWGKTALGKRNGLRVRVFGELGSAEWYQMEPELLLVSDNDGNTLIMDRGSSLASLAQQQRYNRFKVGHPDGFIEAFANLYSDIANELTARKQGDEFRTGFVFGAEHSERVLRCLESIKIEGGR